MIGFATLVYKEVWRFWKVLIQTLLAPVLSALLFQLIFLHTLSSRPVVGYDVNYGAFLIPGLVMMSMLQNAFANSASSLIQSKLNGSLIFILLSPLSAFEFFGAYLIASVLRGLLVGIGVIIAIAWFGLPWPHDFLLVVVFSLLSCIMFGTIGIIMGIVAKTFDKLSAFQNFLIMPLTFLSGAFYSLHSLPDFWQKVTLLNPVFYAIDGFRYSFFGQADISPWLSLTVVFSSSCILVLIGLQIIRSGYRLRN